MRKQIHYCRKVIGNLCPYTEGVKRYWWCLLVVSLFAFVVELVTPIFYKIFVNDVIIRSNISKMKFVIAGYLVTYLLGVVLSYLKNHVKYKLTNKVLYRVRNKILNTYFHIPFSDYDNLSIGDLNMRIDDDIEQIKDYFGVWTIDYIIACVMILTNFLILMSINWILALYSITVIPFTFWIDRILSKKEKIILDERRLNEQNMSSWLHESIQGWREVKAFNLQKYETRLYFHFLHTEMIGFAKWINYWTARVLIIPKIKNECFMQFGLYLIGGLLIIEGNLNIGELLVFSVYYSLLSNAIQSVSTAAADLQTKMPYIDRLIESLKYKVEDNIGIVPDDSNTIELKEVSFGYPDAQMLVINKLNLLINRGERVAITGKSGSGKTTLLKLITGMLTPTSGQISFSGIDLRQIDMIAMHKKIGFVMQENILFHASIKDNLLYAKGDATEEELIQVCKMACIYDFIESLPDGWNTMIGEKGIKLSGGQRQRLVLARLFLRDVDVFIFDEATSALDQLSESIVHDAINRIAKEKTIIVVSHRESSLELCDRIIKIDASFTN